jgi:hypothetical protein
MQQEFDTLHEMEIAQYGTTETGQCVENYHAIKVARTQKRRLPSVKMTTSKL